MDHKGATRGFRPPLQDWPPINWLRADAKQESGGNRGTAPGDPRHLRISLRWIIRRLWWSNIRGFQSSGNPRDVCRDCGGPPACPPLQRSNRVVPTGRLSLSWSSDVILGVPGAGGTLLRTQVNMADHEVGQSRASQTSEAAGPVHTEGNRRPAKFFTNGVCSSMRRT